MSSVRPHPRALGGRLLGAAVDAVDRLRKALQHRQLGRLQRAAVGTTFHPRTDDLFIASYPKSGTTLMQMMLHQLTSDGAVDFPHVESVSPFYEQALAGGRGQLLEKMASPRVFKSHSLRDQLPEVGRFIYLARNPRDVALSAYHHHQLALGAELPRETFLDRFLRGRSLFGSWFRHIESWWPHRHDPNVLFLRFEEVTADLEGTVRRVADFAGIEVDEGELPRIVERCGLDFMKRHDDKFDPRLRRLVKSHPEPYLRGTLDADGETPLSPRHEKLLTRRLAELEVRLGEGLPFPRQSGDETADEDAETPDPATEKPASPPPKRKPPLLAVATQRLGRLHDQLQWRLAHRHVLRPRADDVYLAAYPGTGIPVLRMLIYQLTSDGSLDFPHVESVFPTYTLSIPMGLAEPLEALPSPRRFYTFDRRERLPDTGRFIHLTRDPRAVARANHRYFGLVLGVDLPFELFVQGLVDGGGPLPLSWLDHLESWWPRRHDQDVLHLVYEEVVRDLEGTARRIADFLDLPPDRERLDRAVERSRPAALLEHDRLFDPRRHHLAPAPPDRFIRKGRTGDGRGALTPRQEAELEKRLRTLTRRLGVDPEKPLADLFAAPR